MTNKTNNKKQKHPKPYRHDVMHSIVTYHPEKACHLTCTLKRPQQPKTQCYGHNIYHLVEVDVDRPSSPELCPSQPLHLCGSRPRPGRPTQCFPCGSPSHDGIPLGLIRRIASPVGVSTLECPRWSVHAGVSALTFAAKPQLPFPHHHS